MENAVYNMELKQFLALFADERQVALGNDFCMVEVRYGHNLEHFKTPIRLDAYFVVFGLGGSVRVSVNMKEFVVKKGSLALFVPGNIGHVDYDGIDRENIHYVILGMGHRFLSLLNLDLNRLFSEGVMLLDYPCVTMSEEEQLISMRYLQLASAILDSNLNNKRRCLATLISSIFYLAEGVYSRQLTEARNESESVSTRADDIFNRFLKLLEEFHMKERNVGFYADKLCLSPKYFSKLIKQASGRSAPDWIDSFVILEAKNFLKYSEMSIKEIVYRLNFSDQPTFTKFFKAHTGLTPVQFRKN